MSNEPINQQNNDENLPQAQDVKKANMLDMILFIIAIAMLIIGGLVPDLICIVICVYLLIKKFTKSKNNK